MWYVKLQFLFNNISISLIFLFDPVSSDMVQATMNQQVNGPYKEKMKHAMYVQLVVRGSLFNIALLKYLHYLHLNLQIKYYILIS